MISINKANETNAAVLALLGTMTFIESHGPFIDDREELMVYIETAFSVSKTRQDINNPKHLFYIMYHNDLPIGYAKLVLNATHEAVRSQNPCQLERIYILKDFIPLKVGQQFLTFLEEKAKALEMDSMWLSVYTKNYRALKFYEKNNFKKTGRSIFTVSGKAYENSIFSKKII